MNGPDGTRGPPVVPPPLGRPPAPPPPLTHTPPPPPTVQAPFPGSFPPAAPNPHQPASTQPSSHLPEQSCDTRNTELPAKQATQCRPSKEEEEEEGKDGASGESAETKKGLGKPAKVKMSFGTGGSVLGKRTLTPAGGGGGGGITMKLKPQSEPGVKKAKVEAQPPSKTALRSNVFGDESDDDEEMPPEAKLRMRNIGKNTPTSAGPNSFNKSSKGFSDPRGWRDD